MADLSGADSGTVADVMTGGTGGLLTVFGDDSWRRVQVGPFEARVQR